MLFLDGAYAFSGNRAVFHRAHRPVGEELNRLLDSLSHRIVWVLERGGLLIADPQHPSLNLVPDSSLGHLQAASVAYRIAIGPHAGRKALTLYSVPPLQETATHPLLPRIARCSLHALIAKIPGYVHNSHQAVGSPHFQLQSCRTNSGSTLQTLPPMLARIRQSVVYLLSATRAPNNPR